MKVTAREIVIKRGRLGKDVEDIDIGSIKSADCALGQSWIVSSGGESKDVPSVEVWSYLTGTVHDMHSLTYRSAGSLTVHRTSSIVDHSRPTPLVSLS
jgi:hypothetical protein